MTHRLARNLVLLALLVTAGAGCKRMQTYEVLVINDADTPVTAWMSKNGPPAEITWLSPAELAIVFDPSQEAQMKLPSAILAPGERVRFGPRKGEFPGETQAILDVFEGEMPLADMISLAPRSPRRGRITLVPGGNVVRVTGVDPITVQREPTP